MDKSNLTEKFLETIGHEGVVSIVSWGSTQEPHVANTWNSYLVVEKNRILIPAYGLRKTQKNVEATGKVKLTLGTRNVTGYKDYPGTGFLVEGNAEYLTSGEEYDRMKEKFSFLSRVLAVDVTRVKQTL